MCDPPVSEQPTRAKQTTTKAGYRDKTTVYCHCTVMPSTLVQQRALGTTKHETQ